jgi:hypothetical protein
MFNLFRLFFKHQLYKIFSFNLLKFNLAERAGLNYLSLILFLSFLLVAASCNTTEPPIIPPPQSPKAIKLKLLDVSCTEAFISITASDTVLPVNITLKKDDTAMFSFILTQTDTTVIDTTLQPDISYVYQTTAVIKGKEENSDSLQVKTLNTTSHNFTWQKFQFGTGASSILKDVAIIDENNIWAVGEIYADTTGLPYNAVHWDGSNWELKRISVNFRGNLITPPLEGIFAFSSTDIWLVGSLPIHGDGNNWTMYDLRTTVDPNISLSKAWGNNSSDIYFVGRLGSIAHYLNGSWSKIESGTDLNIVDIWGDVNPFTNKTEIICGAANIFVNPGSELIRIKEDFTTEMLDNTGLGQTFAPLWFKAGIRYYVVGDGLYEKTYKDSSIWLNLNNNITQYFMECIRGNSLNNIILAGAFGEVIHFNGISWVSIKNTETTINNGSYYKVAVKGNVAVAVGFDQSQAVILMGHN